MSSGLMGHRRGATPKCRIVSNSDPRMWYLVTSHTSTDGQQQVGLFGSAILDIATCNFPSFHPRSTTSAHCCECIALET